MLSTGKPFATDFYVYLRGSCPIIGNKRLTFYHDIADKVICCIGHIFLGTHDLNVDVHWLKSQGIEFETVDVIEDPEAFEEMERLSGQTLAPVITVDGQVLADFGARELVVFWEGLGKSK